MTSRPSPEPPAIHRIPRVAALPDSARAVLESDALAHLVTLEADGRPQVSCVWVGLEHDEIVCASLGPRRKLENIRRDPRVSLSLEAQGTNQLGLRNYLVVHGNGRVTEGGGPELLQRLAHVYLGPEVKFPPMDDPPPGWVVRIAIERVGGSGPWTSQSATTRQS
ncbi:MAG: PPOX class F420-dependent enzyme [Solirubrobacterales bacterium]|nr:MAG: PPOX class F420-dependent enzyme [Solirubrobacterales bacterium]